MISAGSKIFDKEEGISVAEYILSNIEDVLDNFDDSTYGAIAKEYHQNLLKKKKIDTKYFLTHKDEKIRQIATDSLSSPYEYSSGWKERYDHPLQTQKIPEENFTKDSIYSLLRFKFKKIIKMCEENQRQIGELQKKGHSNKLMKLIKKQQKLLAIRNEMAAQMNTVVIK